MYEQSDNDSNLPDFLQNGRHSHTTQTSESPSYLRKPFMLIIGLWFAIIFFYIQFFFGWDGLSALLPGEFAAFLATVFIPPAILLLLTALISRTVFATHQVVAVEKNLNRFLLGGDENLLAEVLSRALRKEIRELTESADFLAKQTVALKNELNAKAADFSETTQVLDNFLNSSIKKLNAGSQAFHEQCRLAAEKADESASLFAQRVESLKESARLLNRELAPLLEDTATATENLRQLLEHSQQYISDSKNCMENTGVLLDEQSGKLETLYRRTADNCAEVFQRLDSGVAHIENSLLQHQKLADKQAAILHERANFMDQKLGEYGRLINMEVEAMVKRSDGLDKNIKNQLSVLTTASAKMERILDGANNSLEQKSGRVVRTIDKVVTNLETELHKMSEFIKFTQSKNNEIESAAEKITQQIGTISADLGQKADDLKTRSIEAIDKFNEVSGVMQINAASLTETANILATKGREGAETIEQQQLSLHKTADDFRRLEQQVLTIGDSLQHAADHSDAVFAKYKRQVEILGDIMRERSFELDENRKQNEAQMTDLKQQMEKAGLQNFIALSGQIVDQLENLAVDFNRFFNKEDDALWKKFYDGDHAVFARHIVKNLKRGQVIKIRNAYEKDADFRILADRYMNEFEQILDAAQNSAKASALLAVLTSSDVGKIYYVTARAVGRLDK